MDFIRIDANGQLVFELSTFSLYNIHVQAGPNTQYSLKENTLMSLHYLILDVDGTLTDGGIYYDNHGNELKKFSAKDGTGFVIARTAGIKLVVMTGRECEATTRRMKELKVDFIFQGVKDKVKFLESWIEENGVKRDELGYIGDDINDLKPMKMCGYIGCPSDACEEVKKISNYVSKVKGGAGAARDIIEHYLIEQKLWDDMVQKCYSDSGV